MSGPAAEAPLADTVNVGVATIATARTTAVLGTVTVIVSVAVML